MVEIPMKGRNLPREKPKHFYLTTETANWKRKKELILKTSNLD